MVKKIKIIPKLAICFVAKKKTPSSQLFTPWEFFYWLLAPHPILE